MIAAQPIRQSTRRFSTSLLRQLNSNTNKQAAIEPTTYKSFAQYRLKASQHDPLMLLNKSKALLNRAPIVQIEIKDDYYSFNNKFKQIARAIEYKDVKN